MGITECIFGCVVIICATVTLCWCVWCWSKYK